jgi:hypothetical protein
MINQTCRCSTFAPSADLLPWADPYIVQLFEEAEMVQREESTDLSGTQREDWCGASCSESGSVDAGGARDPWRVTRPRRLAVSRRRRTEFELQLAPC